MIVADNYTAEIEEKKYMRLLDFVREKMDLGEEIEIGENTDSIVVEEFATTRTNIISWMKFKKNAKVLYLNSGCGALSSFFATFASKVDCVEASKIKSQINELRNNTEQTIEYYVGDLDDFEDVLSKQSYDYIFVNEATRKELECITYLKSLLEKDGKIILSCVNKYGLKYMSGTKYSKSNKTFELLYDSKYLCKNSIEKYCKEFGLKRDLYYLYPDEKYTMSIFSDEFLPKEGELVKNFYGEAERVLLFDERKVLDSIIRDGMFDMFTNAYLVIVEGD